MISTAKTRRDLANFSRLIEAIDTATTVCVFVLIGAATPNPSCLIKLCRSVDQPRLLEGWLR